MDVSNSTGESTGYRVVGGGGAPPDQGPPETESKKGRKGGKKGKPAPSPLWKELTRGELEPNSYVTLDVSHDKEVKVEFFNEKGTLAELVVPAGKCKDVLVSLVPNGRGNPKAFLCHRKMA